MIPCREDDGLGASLMAVVCAWCAAPMPAKVCAPAEAGKVSHGMCQACYERQMGVLRGSSFSDVTCRRAAPLPAAAGPVFVSRTPSFGGFTGKASPTKQTGTITPLPSVGQMRCEHASDGPAASETLP
jgi:hypothetical protein